MVSQADVRGAVTPLRLVFWGGLLCLLDLRINGFDILNDLLGAVLIALGVVILARIPVSERYARCMTFVKVVAILYVPVSLFRMMVSDATGFLAVCNTLFSLAALAATLVFCLCMKWFAQEADLPHSARSWHTTLMLYLILFIAPLGGLYLMMLGATLMGTHFNLKIGAVALLIVLAMLIPPIHFFISTSRMRRESECGFAVITSQEQPQ